MRTPTGSCGSFALLLLLVACGGQVDPGSGGPVPLPPREPEQGLYLPTKADAPQHVADDVGTPTALAMTSDRVVFTTRDTKLGTGRVEAGGLFVVEKRGGPPLLLSVDRQGASYEVLVIDATTAFIATSDARLLAVPIAGGEVTTLATLETPATALSLSDKNVYYATESRALGRISKDGGAPVKLRTMSSPIRALEVDEAALYVATGSDENAVGGIVRVPFDDGEPRVIAPETDACAMVRDGRRLFFTARGSDQPNAANAANPTAALPSGRVQAVSLDGGDLTTVASGAFTACALATDRDSLFFATSLPGALPTRSSGATEIRGDEGSAFGLMKAPVLGGEPVRISHAVRPLARKGAIAVDASSVYWLTDTAVLRVEK